MGESGFDVDLLEVAPSILRRIRCTVVGQQRAVELLLAALAARAHVLLEGPPGTAKSLLACSIASAVGLRFQRVQLTPDLMPADLLGTSVWLPNEGRFEFKGGPVFTDVLLADELNRAPPKTQAALLEAMQERQVTHDGCTRLLGECFWVVATQNPWEQEGTYPLPESQLDRFALKIKVDYPEPADERAILSRHRDAGDPIEQLHSGLPAVVDRETLRAWQQRARELRVDDIVLDYIHDLIRATRRQPDLEWGGGPRAGVALLRCAQALALVRRRTYVIPDDVRELVVPVLEHRLRLVAEAQIAGATVKGVLSRVLDGVPVPVLHERNRPRTAPP